MAQNDKRLLGFARQMRTNPTDAEAVLWNALRDRRLNKLKFRRQVSMHGFIVDFVCFDAKLIVEVDGTQHAENDYDVQRDQKLSSAGFKILRFWNDDVLRDLDNVCTHIVQVAILRSK